MDLLAYIPFGKEHAVSRAELCTLTGLPDRVVRREVKRILETGEPVLSSSRYGGYWRSDDPEEWGAFLKESERRIRSERRTNRKLLKKYQESRRK